MPYLVTLGRWVSRRPRNRRSARRCWLDQTSRLGVPIPGNGKQLIPFFVAALLLVFGAAGCNRTPPSDGWEEYTFRTASVLEARWGPETGWTRPWKVLEGSHSFAMVFGGDEDMLDALSDATLSVIQFDNSGVRCVLVEKPLGISDVVKHGRGYHRIDAEIAVQPRWPNEACYLEIGGRRLVFRKRLLPRRF